MASLKEVKGRINSINGTLKITSAMKMVASSKLHKAQEAIENMLPYERRLYHMLTNFLIISATVSLMLTNGTNNATVTVDPNFSGRNLRMTGTLLPYSQSNIFQGTTY